MATLAPASARASETAWPIPSAAPVTTATLPDILNCSNTLEGVSGKGRGNPARTCVQSDTVIDILRTIGLGYLDVSNEVPQQVFITCWIGIERLGTKWTGSLSADRSFVPLAVGPLQSDCQSILSTSPRVYLEAGLLIH